MVNTKVIQSFLFKAIRILIYAAVSAWMAIWGFYALYNKWLWKPKWEIHGIFFCSVFIGLFVTYEIPIWYPKRSRLVKVLCEVISFVACEAAIVIGFIWCLESFISYYLYEPPFVPKYFGFPFFIYVIILWPLMNTLTHLTLIHCWINRTEFILPKYTALFRAVYRVFGSILYLWSMFILLFPEARNVTSSLFLRQFLLGSFIYVDVSHLSVGKEADAINKYVYLPTKMRYIQIFLAIPLIVSIVKLIIIYEESSPFDLFNQLYRFDANREPKDREAAQGAICVLIISLWQNTCQLKRKIESYEETHYLHSLVPLGS